MPALVAKLSNPALFKNVIDSMKDLVKDVNFDCNESGILVQSMDSSNVGMVHLRMKETAFEAWDCPKPFTVGLNMESMHKVFRLCGNNDTVTVETGHKKENEEEPDSKVVFSFESPGDNRLAKFVMTTVDIDAEPTTVPPLEDALTVTIPTGEFKNAVSELKEFGDALIIKNHPEGIEFSSKGDIGVGTVLLKKRDAEKEEDSLTLGGELDSEIDMGFGMRYMNLFTRATPLSKCCKLSLHQDSPLRLKYHLDEESHGFLEFMLAP